MAVARSPVSLAGKALEERLAELDMTRGELVDEKTRRRRLAVVVEAVSQSMLWRWMSADASQSRRINVDDAFLIQFITGLPASTWSRHRGLFHIPAAA